MTVRLTATQAAILNQAGISKARPGANFNAEKFEAIVARSNDPGVRSLYEQVRSAGPSPAPRPVQSARFNILMPPRVIVILEGEHTEVESGSQVPCLYNPAMMATTLGPAQNAWAAQATTVARTYTPALDGDKSLIAGWLLRISQPPDDIITDTVSIVATGSFNAGPASTFRTTTALSNSFSIRTQSIVSHVLVYNYTSVNGIPIPTPYETWNDPGGTPTDTGATLTCTWSSSALKISSLPLTNGSIQLVAAQFGLEL